MNPTDQTMRMNAVAIASPNSALEHIFQGLFGLGMLLGVSLLYFVLLAIEPLLDLLKNARPH